MRYQVFQKAFGTNSVTPLATIETPFVIRDMCWVKDIGTVFSYDSCLGLIDLGGHVQMPWIGVENEHISIDSRWEFARFCHPSGVCYYAISDSIYVAENQGKMIRKVNIRGKEVQSLFKDSVQEREMLKNFGNRPPGYNDAFICTSPIEDIYWSIPSLHRCFAYRFSRVSKLIGTSRAGYSMCNIPSQSHLYSPTGIVHDGHLAIIAEKNNQCVRAMGDQGMYVVCGSPPTDIKHTKKITDSLYNPTKIMLDHNVLYILDSDYIKSCSKSPNSKVVPIIHTQGAVTMSMDDKRNIIWMGVAHE